MTPRITPEPNSKNETKNTFSKTQFQSVQNVQKRRQVQKGVLLPGCPQTPRPDLSRPKSSVVEDRVIIKLLSLDLDPRCWCKFDWEKLGIFPKERLGACFRKVLGSLHSVFTFDFWRDGLWTFQKVWETIFYSSTKWFVRESRYRCFLKSNVSPALCWRFFL